MLYKQEWRQFFRIVNYLAGIRNILEIIFLTEEQSGKIPLT